MFEISRAPTTPTLEIPTGLEISQSSTEAIGHLQQAVRQFAEDNGIEPGNVLYRGYSPNVPIEEGEDNWDGNGQPMPSFGTYDSMDPPELIEPNSIDDQIDRWQVNPLYHALRAGSLGLYDKDKLLELAGQPIDTDVEFGTFVFGLSQTQIDLAEVATMLFIHMPQEVAQPSSPESVQDLRVAELFKPLVDVSQETVDLDEQSKKIASWLTGSVVEVTKEQENAQKKAADEKWRASVTEQSLLEAEPNFRNIKRYPVVQGAVDEYVARTGKFHDRDIMAGLRHDPLLRLTVGKWLTEAVEAHPYSIRSGIVEKNPSARGYEKMTSKEYVALLMMATVDGTFKTANADDVQRDQFGAVQLGLHRTAAKEVLSRLG